MDDLERLRIIEYKIQKIEEQYGDDIIALTKKRGYDPYSEKWEYKINKIAKKYAPMIADLKIEHDELCEKINDEAEERRKKMYVDPQ